MRETNILDCACACPQYRMVPAMDSIPALSPQLEHFIMRWSIPKCEWRCHYWAALAMPETPNHAPTGHTVRDKDLLTWHMICRTFADLNKMKTAVLHELNILEAGRAQYTGERVTEFHKHSPYPPGDTVVSKFAPLMYRYTHLRNLWDSYAASLGVYAWTVCRPSHCFLFFLHLKDVMRHSAKCVLRRVEQ